MKERKYQGTRTIHVHLFGHTVRVKKKFSKIVEKNSFSTTIDKALSFRVPESQ